MKINLYKKFEPLHILKRSIIVIDGCTYSNMIYKKEINLPDGAYLLQIKILPHFYSNTIMLNETDNGKTILIESGFNRNIFLKTLSIAWVFALCLRFLFNDEYLNFSFIFLSIGLIASLYYYSKNNQSAIKIRMQ